MESCKNTGNMEQEIEFKNDEAYTATVSASTSTDNEAIKGTITSVDEAKKAREWFATLSVDDQVVALGFALDQDFLATLSSAATTLSPTIGGSLTTDGHTCKAPSSDLMGPFSPESSSENMSILNNNLAESDQHKDSLEVQAAIALSAVSIDEKSIVEGVTGEPNAMSSMVEKTNGVTTVNNDPCLVKSEGIPVAIEASARDLDAFRIRDGGNEGQAAGMIMRERDSKESDETHEEVGDVTPAEAPAPAPPSSNDDPLVSDEVISNEDRMEHISTFMMNVITASPSAFQLVSPGAALPPVPFPILSLHPDYLSQKSAQDILAALDDITTSGKFLSEPVYNSWNDAVQSLASSSTPSSSSTPLHALLLLRFQLSVLESHRNFLNATASANRTTVPHRHATITLTHDAENEVVGEMAGTHVFPSGSESQTYSEEITSHVSEEIPQVDSPGVEISEALSNAGSVATQQPVTERVVDAKTDTNKVAISADPFIALLPKLVKQIRSAETEGKDTENIIVDLAAFLETSKGDDVLATLKEFDSDVAKRIRTLQESLVVINGPEATPPSVNPSDEGKAEKVESQNSTDALDDSEIQVDMDGPRETPDSALEGGGKKNSKKKKKRKKRKGGMGSAPIAQVPLTVPKIEEEKDEEIQVDIPLPLLEKVDESTQTDGASIDVVDAALPKDTNPLAAVSISEKASEDASSCNKSSSGNAADTLGDATKTPKDNHDSAGEFVQPDDAIKESSLDQVETVAVSPSARKESSGSDVAAISSTAEAVPSHELEEDQEEWETVEVRFRVSRKRPSDKGSNGRFSAFQSHGASKKKNPRTSESRKRVQKRKMVREILISVLDAVDDQVRRRKQGSQPAPFRPTPNAWGTLPTKKNTVDNRTVGGPSSTQPQATQWKEGTTMRDILMGQQNGSAVRMSSPQQVSSRAYADRVRQRGLAEGARKTRDKSILVSSTAADQNTAPTVPETLSAVSTASAFTETPSAKNIPQVSGLARSESSSSESIGATKPQSNSKQTNKEGTLSPPLPTLLGPGNANSSTSSVASSLDAPHVAHHNHHSTFLGNERDVGYHLLRVCDRLTRDIAQFMKRRDQALKIRRHERGLVLSALQDSLSTIWNGGCKVEMYGSCATDLDLPSSDLDVVVCGLDESEQAAIHAESKNASGSRSESDSDVNTSGTDDRVVIESPGKAKPHSPITHTASQPQYAMAYPRMTTNAERVVTLAMELERQPWAVHVKAIPTASVPVIKILADPARLQGTLEGNGDWLVQRPESQASPGDAPDQMPHYQTNMPWRGADVVNGLLKVDITFEGPEHGGIGSTRFSSRVVDEFSKESGLPADETAEVQVLMVLKELLAQRRLNEPFSGGLSSYALLLLVISLVRERSIIRKELERVERQRKLVAAGGENSIPRPGPTDPTEGSADSGPANGEAKAKQSKGPQKNDKTKTKPTKQNAEKNSGKGNVAASSRNDGARRKGNSGKSHTSQQAGEQKLLNGSSGQDTASFNPGGSSSSWASVARKNSASLSKKESQDSIQNKPAPESKATPVKKTNSFAEAVANGSPTNQVSNDSMKARAKRTESKTKASDSKKGKGHDGVRATKADVQAQSNSGKTKTLSSLPVDAPTYEPMNIQSLNPASPTKQTASSLADEPGSFFPQSFHDVIEVLCAGETTPGKLLMHVLLFYGQHFDSHSTAIDYSNTHVRDANANNGYAVSSPYLQRRNTGSYDPMTGMLTVDPIVVYDPLEGAEGNNVARSCFAWSSIRWVFAQSYMTLSSAVEMSAGHQPGKGSNRSAPAPPGTVNGQREHNSIAQQDAAWVVPYGHDESGNVIFDPTTPLLELLLSF